MTDEETIGRSWLLTPLGVRKYRQIGWRSDGKGSKFDFGGGELIGGSSEFSLEAKELILGFGRSGERGIERLWAFFV